MSEIVDIFKNVSFDPLPWQHEMSSLYPNQPFSLTKEYFIRTLIIPVIVLGISILFILSYQMAICCRCCITCCCPTKCKCCFIQQRAFLEGDFKTRAMYYKNTLIAFSVFWLVTFTCTFLMFLPYRNLTSGITATVYSLSSITKLFNLIIFTGEVIAKGLSSLTTAIQQEPCYTAYQTTGISHQLLDIAIQIGNAITKILSFIQYIPVLLSDARYTVTYTFSPILTTVFWWYFGILLVILFLWLLIFCFRSKKYLTVIIVLTEIVVLVLTIVNCIEMYAVRINSSFCYPNPTMNVLNQFPISAPSLPALKYFLTCHGSFFINI